MSRALFVVFVFSCVVFLAAGDSSEPHYCIGNEKLACVHVCPPEKTCKTREIQYSCAVDNQECTNKCICKEGYFRSDVTGTCITFDQCDRCKGSNEYFSCDSACDNECAKLATQNRTHCPIKNIVCNKRCYCLDGFARDDNNVCVPVEKCPKSQIPSPRYRRYADSEPQCSENEVFSDCKKACPPEICGTISGFIVCDPNQECKRGCKCRDGYLRLNLGEPCMPTRQCPQLANAPEYNFEQNY